MKRWIIIIGSLLCCLLTTVIAFCVGKTFIPEPNTFNFEIASLIITNTIVIILFITTYLLIDSRNLIKEENKQCTAQILLTQSFAECYNSINVFTPEVIEKYVVPKCNFNQTSNQDPVITRLKSSNFTF